MLRLKEMRQKFGETQERVAILLNMSQNGYSQWENGKNRIDNISLSFLAEHWNTSTDYLLGRTDNPDPLPQAG